MIARSLISESILPLNELMTESEARAIMSNNRIYHLPVIDSNNNLLGILSEEDITHNSKKNNILQNIPEKLIQINVYAHQHIYEVFEKVFKFNLSSIPVIEDNNKYIGLITCNTLISYFSKITSLHSSGAIIVLEVNSRDYTLSQIAQIIEENNAKILSLYINSIDDSTKIDITIKLNTHEIGGIVQSLTRYNYTIKTYFEGYNKLHDLYKDRIDSLINYLKI